MSSVVTSDLIVWNTVLQESLRLSLGLAEEGLDPPALSLAEGVGRAAAVVTVSLYICHRQGE